jgi:DNA-binding response OmpR family regulator
MRKCLRKNNAYSHSSEILYKNIKFDTNYRKAFIDENEVLLSRKEKQILEFFLLNREICISKSDLKEKFWTSKTSSISIDNTINVTICNLRKKL